ncbi:MAG: DNA polymerase III subunit delta' [Alphaproteobacteria bacterium]|nr:DNA polymerase III subunit delta' [Alphaproteobacteria bacterium]
MGHQAAERLLHGAAAEGRLAHAWLISGPRGIGKATLAYRFARHLLAGGHRRAPDLTLAPEDPVFRQVAVGSHPDLLTIERARDAKSGRLSGEIVVEHARRIPAFFARTAAQGGWRVAIVDAADDLNDKAATAVLKIVEEPPQRGLILLIAHSAGRILPTIRSRCRLLRLQPLAQAIVEDILGLHHGGQSEAERATVAELAQGSAGRALEISAAGGGALYAELIGLVSQLRKLETLPLLRFGERMARPSNEPTYQVVRELLPLWLARLVRTGAGDLPAREIVPGEMAVLCQLGTGGGLDRWVEVWEKIADLFAQADDLNLDKKQVLIAALVALASTARG